MSVIKKIKRGIKNPRIAFKYILFLIKKRKIENNFISNFFQDKEEFLTYKKEIKDSGLIKKMNEKKELFKKLVKKGNFGSIDLNGAILIYCLIRKLKPNILVETGVANGFSTTFILFALYKNKKGKLYSIDFPEVNCKVYDKDTFWSGKGDAVIPSKKTSGWAIPFYLRKNWNLILGKSQDKLIPLLKKLKKIDFFLHDSEHSYDCMMFEFNEAFKRLNKGGILICDDINMNNSFFNFCKKHNKKIIEIGWELACIKL